MELYLVFKKGVYRHECAGCYSTIELAEKAAVHFLKREMDDYHCYNIYLGFLDKIPESDGFGFFNNGPKDLELIKSMSQNDC